METLEKVYGIKPPSDAIAALSLPNVIEQDQVAKYVAMYQQYMDSRNDEIQLARRTAMYYSRFDPQGTGVLKPDQLYELRAWARGWGRALGRG